MQFRVRPTSRKSNNNDVSVIEFPSKSLISTESPMPRSFVARLDQLQTTLSSFQQLYRRQRELSNTSYVDVQKRLDKVQYKTFSAEQDLRQLNEIREIKIPRESFPSNGQTDTSKNQIILLKQMLMQEKEAQKEAVKYQNSIIEQMSHKQMRNEQQLREMINQQRMEYEYRLNGQGEQIRQIEGLKQRKMQQQYDMIKGVIANAERKIYEELERKIRNQTVIRGFIDQKMAQMKEELSNEQKQTLAIETKFVRQTKTSFENVFGLFNNLKKELGDELAETQKLAINNIKKLSMTLDITREKHADEIKQVSSFQADLTNEMAELRNFMTDKFQENREIMSEFEEQAMEKLESSGLHKGDPEKKTVDSERFILFQKEMNQWKTITEQKNLNVFKEISNALKAIKLQWRKQNDELVSEVAAINQSMKTMRKNNSTELKKSIQTIITVFNNEFDVLAEELENLTEMIALAKRENERTFRDQLSKMKSSIQQQFNQLVNQRSKESNQYTDKVVARSEDNMKVLVGKEVKYSADILAQRIEKMEVELNQISSAYKKANVVTTSQLEDYSLKLKTFNQNYKDYLEEQRKEDMKKRIQIEEAMRKNAASLMDMCYKKSQFLVEGLKNNIETLQIKDKMENAQALDNAKDQIKKQMFSNKQQWQKQMTTNIEKLTKERENSEEILHEAIEQSINNTKRNLTNDIGNAKLEIEEKINQMKLKEVQKEAQHEQKMMELKNTMFQVVRDEKKLTEESFIKAKKEVDDQFVILEKNQQNKELLQKQQAASDKLAMENYINTAIAKEDAAQKEQINKVKLEVDAKINQQKQENRLNLAKLEQANRKQAEQKVKSDLQRKTKEGELQMKIKAVSLDLETKNKATNDRIDGLNKKTDDLTLKQSEDMKVREQNATLMKAELEKGIKDLNLVVETKNKATSDKIEEINKKMSDNQLKATQDRTLDEMSMNRLKTELQRQIKDVKTDLDTKDKTTNEKVVVLSKKVDDLQIKEGQGKKVGQQSLNQAKTDLDKEIKAIRLEMETKNKSTADKFDEVNKKLSEAQLKEGENKKANEQSFTQTKVDLQKEIKTESQQLEAKNKVTSDKLQQLSKKLNQSQLKEGESKKLSDQNLTQMKADLQKEIKTVSQELETKNKATTDRLEQLNKKINQTQVKQGESKKSSQQNVTQIKADLQKEIKAVSQELQTKSKATADKIEEISKKVNDTQLKQGESKKAGDQNLAQIKADLQKEIKATSTDVEAKNKATSEKIENINKKLAQLQTNTEKVKGEDAKVGEQSLNQLKTQLQKSIKDLSTEVQTKNKATTDKIIQVDKKVGLLQTNAQKDKGSEKKVGQQSLNQVKAELEKSIKQLQARIEQIQSKDQNEEHEEAIANLRKSVNKLEAMVFSEQAKNKAMFDRMTDDINKLSENITLITNEMRE